MKKLFLISFICLTVFTACKKDAPAYPPVVTKPIVDTTPPFKLQDMIYPNPCNGTFTIKTNTTDSQNVVLYDRWGSSLLNIYINGTTAIVDNSLSSGIYVIRISSKIGTVTQRIVIVK